MAWRTLPLLLAKQQQNSSERPVDARRRNVSVTELVPLRSTAAIRTPARNPSCLSYLRPPGHRRPSDRPSHRDLYHPTFDSEVRRRPSDRPSRRDLYHPTFDSEVPESLCCGATAQSLRARYPHLTVVRGDVILPSGRKLPLAAQPCASPVSH